MQEQPTDEQLRKVFNIDKDNDGSISLDEFIAFTLPAGSAGAKDKATVMGVEVAFKLLDVDSSGKIDFEEFKQFILDPPNEQEQAAAAAERKNDDVLRAIFDRFDENHDGTLSREEIRKTLIAWGQEPGDDEAFEKDFKKIDTNGDGVISFEEFKSFIKTESMMT